MSCEICGGNGHRRDLHDLADRIAKLEAAMLDSCTQCGNETRCAKHAARPVTTAAAGPISRGFRHELAALINRHSKENGSNTPDYILADFLVASMEAFEGCVERREQWYGRDKRKVEPPAEQPVSAAGEERDPGAEYEEMNQQRQRLCRDIVEAHKERDEAMAICGRAADEILRIRAERDAAVAAERERCLYHVETYEPRRDLSADWNYYGALNRVAEAIRSGEPAPK